MKSSKRIGNITREILALGLSLIILLPLMIMFLGSFKTSAEADLMSLELPAKWMFSNYLVVIEKGKILRGLLNSLFVASTATTINIVICAMCAFILARVNNKMTKILFSLFMLGLFMPPFLIALIYIFKMLQINGTYLALIIYYVVGSIPMSMFIFMGFIKTIPKEIDEAAFVEGASSHQIFFVAILPLLKPVTVTAVLLTTITIWNDFTGPLYLLSNSKYWTLPLAVYNFFGLYSRDWNLVFADLILTMIPIVILYFVLQKNIVEGMTSGAVKG